MRQTQALKLLLDGRSVFLTGPPGAGKTHVLNEFIRRAGRTGQQLAVTASTGIAATHIGGTTIHSWSGLGIRDQLYPHDREWLASNDRLKKRYNGVDVLIIDEISMLHGTRLDMVDEACKLLRGNTEPFGGLQVVLVGDLFQLPPVNRASELVDFAHTSAAWRELNPAICYLSEQHRQQNDTLLSLLEAMRAGQLEEAHIEALQARLGQRPTDGQIVTKLFTHNVDVEALNQRQLTALPSEGRHFEMLTKGSGPKIEQLVKSVLAPPDLELKLGAEVMFVANNFAAGFANGSRGQVIGFADNLPEIRLIGGRIIKVEPHTWTLTEDDRKRAEVMQLPLRLAWAITIHKSQGMSLDAAEIDLSRSFTPGMGYVALSRVRSMDGVFLAGINQLALQLHPDIFAFDRELRRASQALAQTTPDVDEESSDSVDAPKQFDEALFLRLKTWRTDRARADHVAPYMVAHDTTLEALAARPPLTPNQLLATKGFGPKKAETYGPEILTLVSEYLGTNPPAEDTWTPDEEAALLTAFQQGIPLGELAERFGRDPDELWQHLRQLLS